MYSGNANNESRFFKKKNLISEIKRQDFVKKRLLIGVKVEKLHLN